MFILAGKVEYTLSKSKSALPKAKATNRHLFTMYTELTVSMEDRGNKTKSLLRKSEQATESFINMAG